MPPSALWRRGYIIAAALVASAVVASCEKSPTEPLLRLPLDPPSFNIGSGDQFEVIGPITVSGDGYASVSSTSGLPTFTNATLVEVAMSGYIRRTSYSGTVVDVGPLGFFAGGYTCWKKSRVDYTHGSTANGAGSCTPATPVDTVVTTFRGTGTAYVGAGYVASCAPYAAQCYTYSGNRFYVMRIPRPAATLTASRNVIDSAASPDTVRFTVDWAQKTHRGYPIPVTVGNWRWKADTAAQASAAACQYLPAAEAKAACRISVAVSGVMFVDVQLNGRDTTLTERVNVVPCPTGNPLLDNMHLRQQYVDYHTASLNRLKETPFVVIQSGSNYTTMAFPENTDTRCTADVPHPTTLKRQMLDTAAGEKVVAIGHTHLYAPRVRYPCPTAPGGFARSPRGAGDLDWPARDFWSEKNGQQVPMLIVGPDHIFVLNPGGRPGHELKKTSSPGKPQTQFSRKGCGWPQ